MPDKSLIELLVTEGKSQTPDEVGMGAVRVFVDDDLHYGVFVPEETLLALLDIQQSADYFNCPKGGSARLKVSRAVAQAILDLTPASQRKQVLRPEKD